MNSLLEGGQCGSECAGVGGWRKQQLGKTERPISRPVFLPGLNRYMPFAKKRQKIFKTFFEEITKKMFEDVLMFVFIQNWVFSVHLINTSKEKWNMGIGIVYCVLTRALSFVKSTI